MPAGRDGARAMALVSTSGGPDSSGSRAANSTTDRGPRAPCSSSRQAGAVALGDAVADLGPGVLRQAQRVQHLARQPQVAEIDGDLGEADRLQRRRRQRDDLRVAARPGHAGHLDARLDDLPLRSRPLVEPHHRALVGQAQRSGLVAEAGGDQAGDLRRDVRRQRHHLARARLDEADGGRPPGAAQAQGQHVLVFEGGRDHPGEAPAVEHRQQRLGNPASGSRRLWREIAHTGGQTQCGSDGSGQIETLRARLRAC